jgi:general secretion pathway protein D/MSHA biogenesis protein MshL
MKHFTSILQISGFLLLTVLLSSCANKKDGAEEQPLDMPEVSRKEQIEQKPQLPMRYQRPAYMIGEEIELAPVDEGDDVALKVGATIRSTTGPQPLWDILKRLAAMKGMNVSWESDVDQDVLVDVDINAKDDFYKAIDNLLRQVDYFHEMQGDTIVVKYKETRRYQIGMPYTKQLFETGTGGNVLGGNDTADNIEGTIRLDSKGNEYDIWANIEENLNAILQVWKTEEVTEVNASESETENATAANAEGANTEMDSKPTVTESTRRRSGNENLYIIDRSIGQITVTAPRPLLEKVDEYIASLKVHLYKQIAIEAKILEVQLSSESNIGINWDQVLRNFNVTGTVDFGGPTGLLWSQNSADETRFVSTISIGDQSWSAFINALKEEGQTKVLSNPKISVMNGQPALITVGRNVTYIDNIESDLDSETGVITYTVNTERILSGIGMALTATIIDGDEVVMNLTPVTSELEEPIEYRDVGTQGAVVGLPIVNIREMSTTVKVRDGEMLVIGGLISDDKDDNSAFLPGTEGIPLVKYLFGHESKRKNKRELIILLKPVVI